MFLGAVGTSCAGNQRIDADEEIPSTGRVPKLPSKILINSRNHVEDRKKQKEKKRRKEKSTFGMRGTATEVILLVKITADAINLSVSGSLQDVS